MHQNDGNWNDDCLKCLQLHQCILSENEVEDYNCFMNGDDMGISMTVVYVIATILYY